MEAEHELCLYKLRNALTTGPAQWGMREQNTCFVWNALTVVFILVFWRCPRFNIGSASNSREPHNLLNECIDTLINNSFDPTWFR